ncbi:MAG: bifunctional 4-hydroxy-2-oxoglutarate aldolase/2-dehydro-3-deoxy-phosphogluconate aldolase [Haliscomenobacter sp.]
MAKYTRIQVAQAMQETGLVPLFYHEDVELCKGVLKACYDGGARLLEFTNRGDFAHEVFAELNKYCLRELPGMMLGVGSIQDGGTASLYLQLGANFIVTPVLREDIAIVCNRRKILWASGCGTLTEIARAEELGAEVVKVFPGGVVGPAFVKDIKGPCPWTSVMPTGGVAPTEESLRKWFDAGVTCVGMGSQLITKEILQGRQFDVLAEKVKSTMGLIRQIRS